MTAISGFSPAIAQADAEPAKKSNKVAIGFTIAGVVAAVAAAALTAVAYSKGLIQPYLQPLLGRATHFANLVIAFATKSPIHATALIVGVIGATSLLVYLGKLTVDAIRSKTKAEPVAADAPKVEKKVDESKNV